MSQQPPHGFYGNPTQPGGYGYPPVPPAQKPSIWQRYTTAKRPAKVGIGCAMLFLAFLLCGTMSGIVANATGANKTAALDPTAQPATRPPHVVLVTAVAPTHTPTSVVGKPTHTPTPKPTVAPTQAPVPTSAPTQPPPAPTQPPQPTGLNGNPWGYSFVPGNLIYSPAADFCSYFGCVSTFWTATRGYVVECVNGLYSHSGGIRGACSRDGGPAAILYSH